MRAVNIGEVGAAGVAVDILLETLLVAVAGGVVEGAPFISPAVSTASCTAAATPSSTIAASTAAVLPVRCPSVGRTLRCVAGPPALVTVVIVLTADEALHPAGVTFRMQGNPVAHNRFSVGVEAGQVVYVDVS